MDSAMGEGIAKGCNWPRTIEWGETGQGLKVILACKIEGRKEKWENYTSGLKTYAIGVNSPLTLCFWQAKKLVNTSILKCIKQIPTERHWLEFKFV